MSFHMLARHLVKRDNLHNKMMKVKGGKNRHGYQRDTEFKSTVTTTFKRKRKFFVLICMTYKVPVNELHIKYCNENPVYKVSVGMFLNLWPFYVWNVNPKDMKMCVCKLHLHIHSCITALFRLAARLEITFNIPQLHKYL